MILLFIAIMAVSWFVQNRLTSKFRKYSMTPISSNMSGKEIAEKMLSDHGIYDVKVISVNGELTDHYNPVMLQQQLQPMNVVMRFNTQEHTVG